MSIQRQIGRTGVSKVKRALGVQGALEWAFRVEQAQLELPPPKDVTEEGFGFGLEYVLLQRAMLGCKVDGGQHKMGSYTHPDAEVIAATVAGMPDSLGGIRMAIQVAELARAGLKMARSVNTYGIIRCLNKLIFSETKKILSRRDFFPLCDSCLILLMNYISF